MKKHIAFVTADFHADLAAEMIAFATDELHTAGGELVADIRVAGCYEVPLIINRLLADKELHAVVVLGYIEKGETLHGEVMGTVVFQKLVDLQIHHNKPIGMGIIGPGATVEQAHVRKEGSARGAVRAALRSLTELDRL